MQHFRACHAISKVPTEPLTNCILPNTILLDNKILVTEIRAAVLAMAIALSSG